MNNTQAVEIECAGCHNIQRWTKASIYDGDPVAYEDCEFCEGEFCTRRCYRAHECVGHEAEIVPCIWCQTDCEIKSDVVGSHIVVHTRPALIEGDPVCATCAFFKPWDKPTEKFIIETNRMLEMLKAKKVELPQEKV